MTFLFEKLTVYQKAMDFVNEVYALKSKIADRAIKDQLLRAALSVPLIQLCFSQDYVDSCQYESIYNQMNEIGKMLSGLIKSVGQSTDLRTLNTEHSLNDNDALLSKLSVRCLMLVRHVGLEPTTN